MECKVTQDAVGTHIDWSHEGVTARMIDWFWSNMEKGYLLWHPAQHEPLEWAVPVKHGNPIGSIHIAPQTWNDGQRQNLYIRFEDPSTLPEHIKKYITHEHVAAVAGLGLGPEALRDGNPMGYRIHQWSKTDSGVVGRSSGIGTRKIETPEEGIIWSQHCIEEIGTWGDFLPALYNLYKVIKNTSYNPYADLSVEGQGTPE
ncbi:MAG: hypothetical protein HGA22_07995, partial [Clostridiales bacterium]|nr:hypothetical protein [Clostridiales bacterium]